MRALRVRFLGSIPLTALHKMSSGLLEKATFAVLSLKPPGYPGHTFKRTILIVLSRYDTCMPSIELLIPFPPGKGDLGCIDHNADVSFVFTRLIRRFILALQNDGQSCRQMTHHLHTSAGVQAIRQRVSVTWFLASMSRTRIPSRSMLRSVLAICVFDDRIATILFTKIERHLRETDFCFSRHRCRRQICSVNPACPSL